MALTVRCCWSLDEEDFLSQLSDPEDSPDESLEDAVTPQTSHTHKQVPHTHTHYSSNTAWLLVCIIAPLLPSYLDL